MAEGLNKVLLLGNLGADPELRVTPGGQAVLKLRLATTESYLDKSNTAAGAYGIGTASRFGASVEKRSRKFLTKGDRLFIEGRIQTSTYEKNGEKRLLADIIATKRHPRGGGGRGRGDRPEGEQPRSSARSAPSSGARNDDMPAVQLRRSVRRLRRRAVAVVVVVAVATTRSPSEASRLQSDVEKTSDRGRCARSRARALHVRPRARSRSTATATLWSGDVGEDFFYGILDSGKLSELAADAIMRAATETGVTAWIGTRTDPPQAGRRER